MWSLRGVLINWKIVIKRGFLRYLFYDSEIRHGFMDFVKPIEEKGRKMYPGVDTRDNFQGWNVST